MRRNLLPLAIGIKDTVAPFCHPHAKVDTRFKQKQLVHEETKHRPVCVIHLASTNDFESLVSIGEKISFTKLGYHRHEDPCLPKHAWRDPHPPFLAQTHPSMEHEEKLGGETSPDTKTTSRSVVGFSPAPPQATPLSVFALQQTCRSKTHRGSFASLYDEPNETSP